MSYDWISKSLYFVDGSKETIELVLVGIENENHMRKIILDHRKLSKPCGIAVHPIHGYLFVRWGVGTFFQIPLALTMPISNNFQLNGASVETLKLWVLH